MKKIVLAGGTGFLGRALGGHLRACGYEVVVLTRALKINLPGVRLVHWDGQTAGSWVTELENAVAIVNLSGRSVNCRYTDRNRREILRSRIEPTRAIGVAIAQCRTPPSVWLNASTATIYKHTFGAAWDEAGEIGAAPEAHDQFSIEVARAWESALYDAKTPGTRKVALRMAMVLGEDRNSVFPVLRRLVRFGLGGRMGSGQQFVSWIHQDDFCRAVQWLIEQPLLSGAVNICAPGPVTNAKMMRVFRSAFGRRIGLPASAWMLELGAAILRTETELILKSRRALPGRLLDSGFRFEFPTLENAVAALARGSQS